MLEKIRQLAENQASELTELRHYFHANPELSWQEIETTRKITGILRDLGFSNIRTGFGGTESGVTAEIGTGGPVVALRADIDALPLTEENDVPYRSTRDGVMHACGHDAHATMLIGTARILAEIREDLPGTVKLIFQPAEEHGLKSGAKTMMEEGVLEGVDAIAGMHIWAPVSSGTIGFRNGPVMTSADAWEIKVTGKGGHGSMPHKAIDPTIAAATVITTMQTVVSREVDPQDIVVLSIGKVNSGSAVNIIPETATLSGNVRTTSRETREAIPEKMERIMKGICSATRCQGELIFHNLFPVNVNDETLNQIAKEAGLEMYGEEAVMDAPLVMGSEDFAYYGEQIPSTFFFLGSGNEEKGTNNQHHSTKFNVDDDVLPSGSAMLAGFAWKYLSEKGK